MYKKASEYLSGKIIFCKTKEEKRSIIQVLLKLGFKTINDASEEFLSGETYLTYPFVDVMNGFLDGKTNSFNSEVINFKDLVKIEPFATIFLKIDIIPNWKKVTNKYE